MCNMNKKFHDEIKEYVLGLLTYIRPNFSIDENTMFSELALEDIDFTLIAIECEENFKVIVDENILSNCFFVKDVLDYLISLLKEQNQSFFVEDD